MLKVTRFGVCAVLIVVFADAQDERECPHCKKKNKPTAEFCGGCGKKMEGPEEKPQDPPKDKPKPKGIEGVGLTAEQVNKAIDRGADFLIAQYRAKKIDDRESLLCGLALMHAGAFDRAKDVRAGILKRMRDSSVNSWGVYNVAILAMLLDEMGTDDLRLADCAKYLVETQGPAGTWSYGKKVPQIEGNRPQRKMVTVSGGVPIDMPGKAWIEIRRENPKDFTGDGDNSCTQYAVLGLRAAARRGIGIPKETWEKAHEATSKNYDNSAGGWGYSHGGAYGSMTCAAATTLAISGFYIDGRVAENEGVRHGAEWVAKNFTVQKHPPDKTIWLGYYLYSLERFGLILGEEFFGEHEWYPLGARTLVDSQKADGSWEMSDENNPDLSTMFALLFLTRATPALKPEIKRGGSGTLVTETVLPGEYFYIILDASGSMTKKLQGKSKFEIAVEAVEAFAEVLPDTAGVGLRVYGHRWTAIDEKADTDSQLEIPIGKLDRAKFAAKLKSLRCRGKTPLTHSLRESAKDLAALPTEAEVTLILLTDGIESTHGAKPDVASGELIKARPTLRLVVLGFDVTDRREQDQLRSIATSGKGTFLPAADSSELVKGLTRGVAGSGDYVLFDGAGKEIAKGELGDRRTLKEGKYELSFQRKEKEVRQEFWINTDAVTRIVVDLFTEDEK